MLFRTKVMTMTKVVLFRPISKIAAAQSWRKIPNIFIQFTLLLSYLCAFSHFNMANQHSNLTHRSAEEQSVPSRADDVSNVRILYCQSSKCPSLSSSISITPRMTDENRSYLTPYKIFSSPLYVRQTKMHLPKRPVTVFRLKEVAHALPWWNTTNLTSYPNSWI